MKKAAIVTLAVTILSIFAAAPAPAQAAFVEDKLAEVIAMDPNVARIQQLLQVKKDLDQGNKKAVVEALLTTALERTGNGNIATVVTADMRQTAEAAIRQEIEARVGDKIAPYTKGLSDLAALFNVAGQLQPKAAAINDSLPGAPENYRKMLQMTATAYAPGAADNGKWGNRTHVGTTVRKGVAAVDPTVIPLGTKLWVEGYGEAVAEDTGSAIKGNRIDLAFNGRQEALNYGIKKVNVYVLN